MEKLKRFTPERMTPNQRCAQVADILSQGLLRLREKNTEVYPPINLDSESHNSLAIPAYRSVNSETAT